MKLQPVIISIVAVAIASCWHDSSAGTDGGAGSDADGDSDTDADNDADSDADADTDTDADTETDTGTGTGTGGDIDLAWVSLPGGTFQMGSDSVYPPWNSPAHDVTVPGFEMTKTEVTVAQYANCVEAFACAEPVANTGESNCNWGDPGYEEHPVNCVSWHQAVSFCQWIGGRLPSEAEWEYAASGAGQDITYPWGDEQASCEYAVMSESEYPWYSGCGTERTWPVCSKPAGNTSQGLCDMAGNVYEWVQDVFHGSYDCDANPDEVNCGQGGTAPTDGSAWEGSGAGRCLRGGCFVSGFPDDLVSLQVTMRQGYEASQQSAAVGFRCARDGM